MSNQTNQAAVPATQDANGGAVQKAPKKVDVLKGILKADSVQEQFRNALGKNSSAFVASVIDLYNTDKGSSDWSRKVGKSSRAYFPARLSWLHTAGYAYKPVSYH